jgi:hypothetical protein
MKKTLLVRLIQMLFAVFVVIICGCTELQNSLPAGEMFGSVVGLLQGSQSVSMNEQTVAAGLKEALRVGTERTVGQTSKLDGFLTNALIRIALPEELRTTANVLKKMGFGSQVNALETAMNRAAEKASGEAKAVFWEAITQMTLKDAYSILRGGDTAATDYFKARTSASLNSRFQPIVTEKMSQVGAYKAYNQFKSTYNTFAFTSKSAPDLDSYVTQKTIDGLFLVLAQEEKRIREDPAARTTALLKQVFGSAN